VINISATLPYLGTIGQSHAPPRGVGVDSLAGAGLRVGPASA
jgi:hypothetical protein